MKIEQRTFDTETGWQDAIGSFNGVAPQFALVFGGRHVLEDASILASIRELYPQSRLIVASTSGEISNTVVSEDTVAVTAVAFEKTEIDVAAVSVTSNKESYSAGEELARRLIKPGLVHVFAVSDGQLVNGTELCFGFNERLPDGVTLTGGLAGDGARFEKTLVGLDEVPSSGKIVAIGFYGADLKIGFGSSGGWQTFGPERIVTRAEGNILYELDGQSALELYENYLGDQAALLPASALRFPLCVTTEGVESRVVRTILSIDSDAGSMVFAGDIPDRARVRFMRASYEDLIGGAAKAAEQTVDNQEPDLAICISCVGRRIVLGQRVEEETENVRQILGERPALTGFYSYGELAPTGNESHCQLHNQTMTVTTFREV